MIAIDLGDDGVTGQPHHKKQVVEQHCLCQAESEVLGLDFEDARQRLHDGALRSLLCRLEAVCLRPGVPLVTSDQARPPLDASRSRGESAERLHPQADTKYNGPLYPQKPVENEERSRHIAGPDTQLRECLSWNVH